MNTDIVETFDTVPFGQLQPGYEFELNSRVMVKSSAKFTAEVRSRDVVTNVEDYNCFCLHSGRPAYVSDECKVVRLKGLGFKRVDG